ncbi:ATP-dependent Clp protease adapter ClpS [Guyparkeria sp.]|uniref:ATP-dependent Clp protease adapter ClpS n=1 Tax=Guyparkeria sp. TaxID=2035736 RepID=UPI0035688FD1
MAETAGAPHTTHRPAETEEASEQIVSDEPPMYRVLLLNDDFTPMDFVVQVLMQLFGMTFDQANIVMLEVHHNGRGVCGEFTREIAETRVSQVNQIAREHEYPLMCVMERAE